MEGAECHVTEGNGIQFPHREHNSLPLDHCPHPENQQLYYGVCIILASTRACTHTHTLQETF